MTRISSRNPVALLLVFLCTTASSITLATEPNYAPPQLSAEFSTPEATAKIAAKAGFLDIVGVKLGLDHARQFAPCRPV
ncbi:MAG: hypothetical protein E8D47_00890 [Nitrospira sp.]|nr:MAG: hypothetical protein E8D47_00890 [Nitrospira sp.]